MPVRTAEYLAKIRDVNGIVHAVDMRQVVQITPPRAGDESVSLVMMDSVGKFKTLVVRRTEIPALHPNDEME